MEENTDITYIPFGTDGQIEETPLMETLANNVNAYVESKPWSRKKKQRFMDAYSAIMQRGLVGASVKDGQWYVDYNGDPISYANKKDQDMYEQAAYFIKSQMQGLATSQKDKKDKEDAETPLFGNAYLNEQFEKYLINNEFGGRQGTTTQDWNEFDERGSNGLRGTSKRAEIFARNLESFAKSLEDGKYNFKDSPYRDLDDVKQRISAAITALRTPDTADDKAALNKLGIDYNKWFYDGGNDKMTAEDGTEMTVNDYYTKYKPALDKAAAEKAAAEAKQKQQAAAAKQAQLRQTQFSSLKFYTPKGSTGTFANLQRKYAGEDLGSIFSSLATSNLNSEQSADLITLFREAERTGQLSQLSNAEKQAFGRFSNLTGRLKKLEGVEGFYWDSAAKRIVQPSRINGQSILTGGGSSLLNPKSLEEQRALADNTPRGGGKGLTARDWVDIGATIGDIAAVVDPEIISGTGLALLSSVARGTNRDWKNDFWGSLRHQAFDTGTAALGGLPLLGDAISGAKVVKSLANVLKISAVWSAVSSVPEAAEAANKVVTGKYKELTPADFRALANVLIGVYTGKAHVTKNLRERKVLKESGYDVQQGRLSRMGLRSSRVNKTTQTIKAKVNGEEKEIEISDKTRGDIETALKEAGTDVKARNDKVTEILRKEGKVKLSDDVTVNPAQKLLGENIPKWKWLQNRTTNTSRGIFGERTYLARRTGRDNFEDYLQTRSTSSKWGLGTNRNLRTVRKNLGIEDLNLKPYTTPNAHLKRIYETPAMTTPSAKEVGLPSGTDVRSYINNALGGNPKYTKRASGRYVKPKITRTPDGKIKKENQEISEQINLGNKESLNVNITKDGKLTIKDSSGKVLLDNHALAKDNYTFDIKEQIAKVVREQRYNLVKEGKIKPISKELVQSLKEMKRKGLLYKYGGKLTTRQILENFYKTL